MIWVKIEETNSLYINPDGEILSVNKKNKGIVGLVKPILNDGYLRIKHYKNGKYRTLKIHRIVAKYFCNGYSENKVVNHIDGNKINNNYKNLEWVSLGENTYHAYRIGLMVRQTRDMQTQSKIKTSDFPIIAELRKTKTLKDIAKIYKCSIATVHRCVVKCQA